MDPLLLKILMITSPLGFLTVGLTWFLQRAIYQPKFAHWRIRPEKKRTLKGDSFDRQIIKNAIAASVTILLCVCLFRRQIFTDLPPTSWWILLWQPIKIILLYDFMYYFLHRFAFHKWVILSRVHAVHHRVRYPTAIDNFYAHPLETIIVMCLLFGCMAIVGPIYLGSVAIFLLFYTLISITEHGGLIYPQSFTFLNNMAIKHDNHHIRMVDTQNFSALTGIPDIIFKTDQHLTE